MDIEVLIRDLILEDQFKAKYTKRQRSIFCKNMYSKISTFLKKHETELEETNAQLEQYKIAYKQLMKRSYGLILLDMFYSIATIGSIIYFYYILYSYFIKTIQIDQLQTLL